MYASKYTPSRMDRSWAERIAFFDAKLAPIAKRPIDTSEPDWVDKMCATMRSLPPMDEAGIRPEAESLLLQLVEFYRTADESDRCRVRDLFQRYSSFAWAVVLPFGPESDAGFLAHLLHISMLDQARDPRDELVDLQSILKRAKEAGIDIRPSLREVAKLSSRENRYGAGSVRDWMLRALKNGCLWDDDEE